MAVPSEADIRAAFPEYEFEGGTLGKGGAKLALPCRHGGSPVVLKVFLDPLADGDETDSEDSDPTITLPERMAREIAAMKSVVSPRVAAILEGPDVRTIGGTQHVWFLERRYSDETLRDRLGTAWETEAVRRLMCDLLEAIVALWSNGIVHRDIKPRNIVFDEDGGAVLLDLGIVLMIDERPITEKSLAGPGTSQYAAPEQFLPRKNTTLDFRTDLFLVGLVAFEAATGSRPFGKTSEDGWYDRLCSGRFDEGLLAQQADDVRAAIARFLAPTPNQRFRTLSQARAALGGCK